MKKNDSKRKSSLAKANEPTQPRNSTQPVSGGLGTRPMRWDLVGLFLLISIGGSYLVLAMNKPASAQFTFEVSEKYPHDKTAFTQGLLLHDGFLWESTGKRGASSFRKVELKTGEVIKSVPLDDKFFGEGLTLLDGLFYQLTWQENVCLVYNEAMEKVNEFKYEGEGWGLTNDGEHLIMSDGSSVLKFIDPKTFEVKKKVNVRLGNRRASTLNELEYVDGKIYANVWMQNIIYVIDSKNGDVTNQIDLDGLWPQRDRPNEGILNGIAFDRKEKKLLVTGKYAPNVWAIDVISKDKKK